MSPKPDRLNQVPSWEFRNRRKSFTPRQLKEKGHEKARASKLEGKLEMLETQIIPRTAEEMQSKLRRK